jgi:hypothetical protein
VVHILQTPKGEVDLGLPEGTLPTAGRSYVVRVEANGNMTDPRLESQPTTSALGRLTEVMDQAWDAGQLTPDAIEKAIMGFRKAHPYGR